MSIEFPQPLRSNGRLYWRRSQLEAYKRDLIREAMGASGDLPDCPAGDGVETLVPAGQVSREFGFGRRTLGRRIACQPDAAEAEAV